jgi:hypothetical protein
MIKAILGLFTLSAFFALGCGDSSLPTEAAPRQPTPSLSLLPVVLSVEPNSTSEPGETIIIRGSHFAPAPRTTFEAGGLAIRLDLVETNVRGDYVVVTVPPGTPAGMYTPCVETINGKGCGSFFVRVTG